MSEPADDYGAETLYGFKWGPMEVVRAARLNGRRLLLVKTAHRTVEVAVSATGRSVRLFIDGKPAAAGKGET